MGTGTAVPVLLVAGFLALVGIAIRYGGAVGLIAGYDPAAVADEEGLAAFVGTNTLYVAGLTAAVAVVEYVGPPVQELALWLGYTVAVGLLTVRMVWGSRRFEASS